MAQYAQTTAPSGYSPDWLGNVGSSSNTADAFNDSQSILNPNDSAFMNNFFSNPDGTGIDEGFLALNWGGMEQKPSGAPFGAQMLGFDEGSQTIHNPAVTLSSPTTTYRTHADQLHARVGGEMTHYLSHQSNLTSDEDIKAASGLYNMSNMSSNGAYDYSRALGSTNNTSGTWGSFGAHDPVMHLAQNQNIPETSLAHQPANSYSFQPLSPSLQQMPGMVSQQELIQRYYQQQQQQQLLLSQNLARSRYGSLQIDASSQHTASQQGQMRTIQSAHPHFQDVNRPMLVQFGSDGNFSNRGYMGPTSHLPLEQEKGGNLNEVPFAAQVAANGHVHMQPFSSASQGHLRHPSYNRPGSDPNIQSTNPSPRYAHGLPITSPISAVHPHTHPFSNSQMARQKTDNGEPSSEDEFTKEQRRKRRKSQLNRDEDEDNEYLPTNKARASLPKRTPKAAKAPPVEESDDSEFEPTPPTTKATAKRRKGGPSLSSSQTVSPSPPASPSMGPPSNPKKKARSSQPRLNLSEEQKRKNHILSEKNRRDLIKSNYDQLDEMVPALGAGQAGLSRADILAEIAAFVRDVSAGNDELEHFLDENAKATVAGGSG